MINVSRVPESKRDDDDGTVTELFFPGTEPMSLIGCPRGMRLWSPISCLGIYLLDLRSPTPAPPTFGHIYVGPCHAACPLQLHIN